MISVPLWLTTEHQCSYFGDRLSQSIVVQNDFPIDMAIYGELIALGFRRSGDQVYRPYCQNCSACVPSRIAVADFHPDRKQRRCAKRNADTQVIIKTAEFNERHFELYQHYQATRHAPEQEHMISRDDYLHFLGSAWCNTWFVEFLIENKLAAVAVVDALDNALSAVYTFFDPAFNAFSPGVYAVLWQIEEARRRGMDYVYLGFWIKDCRKMSYKIQYQPLYGLINHKWQPIFQHQIKKEE
ncbi:MAG: arginyltransferase [Gammaproteobacteria bacterium]